MGTKRIPPRPSAGSRRGRPLIHDEPWSKVSVVLMNRQIARLDRLVADVFRASGAVVTRAGVIRALVDGVIDGGLDVAGIASESDLRHRVGSHLKTYPLASTLRGRRLQN